MDFVQDYITLLPRFLPASVASPLLTIITISFGILKTLQTHLSPLLTRIATQPDVASILALLAILFLSLKILDMAYRAVMFWVNLVFRLLFWGGIAALGLWVWSRGPDGFLHDVQELGQYWWAQYAKFASEAKGWKDAEDAHIQFEAWKQQVGQAGGARRTWQ